MQDCTGRFAAYAKKKLREHGFPELHFSCEEVSMYAEDSGDKYDLSCCTAKG